jgi:hypothetical protein
MRALREAPDDPAVWAAWVERARRSPVPLTTDAADALALGLGRAAWRSAALRILRDVRDEPPELAVALGEGGPRVLRRGPDGWWDAGAMSFEEVAAAGYEVESPGLLAEAAQGIADALALGPGVELERLQLYGVRQVVEEVTDPERQWSLDTARALDPDVQVGDELLQALELETRVLWLHLLAALCAHRPLPCVDPPDATEAVAAALSGEARSTGKTTGELLRWLDGHIVARSAHDYPPLDLAVAPTEGGGFHLLRVCQSAPDEDPSTHPPSCAAHDVGVAAGSRIGFARGPVPDDVVREKTEEAIRDWAWELEGQGIEEPTVLAELLPARAAVVRELLRRVRDECPIASVGPVTGAARRWDVYPVARRLEQLGSEARRELLVRFAEALAARLPAPLRSPALDALRALPDEGDPTPARDAFAALYEARDGTVAAGLGAATDLCSVILYLGDSLSRRQGHVQAQRFGSPWCQDAAELSWLYPALARLDDDALDRLFGAER